MYNQINSDTVVGVYWGFFIKFKFSHAEEEIFLNTNSRKVLRSYSIHEIIV